MIFVLLTPPQGPRGLCQKQCAVARPIHVSNSQTKFRWISSNGVGGDSITDGRMDGPTEAIVISPSLFIKKNIIIDRKSSKSRFQTIHTFIYTYTYKVITA